MNIKRIIVNFFTQGHKRSLKAKRQILYSLFIKGLSIASTFALVPLILKYLDQESYGIWLTLSSIIGFASFFDLGLGNGLRNLYTKAVTEGNHSLARTYVSTAYGTITIFMSTVLICFLIINPLLNWQTILNTSYISNEDLSYVAFIIVAFFLLRFVFNLIGFILLADQRPAINSALSTIASILSLIIIFILSRITEGSLLSLAIVLCAAPVIVLFAANIHFFYRIYKKHSPSLKFFQRTKIKSLLGLGMKFFILQLGAIILISTDNIIVSQLFGPKEVVVYMVAMKYMGISMMIYLILLSPIWSASTEAYHIRDFVWIKNTIRRYEQIALIFIILTLFMVLTSKFFYGIWLGHEIEVPLSLTLSWGLNSSLLFYASLYTNFLNGIGKIRISLYISIFTITLNIPLSILFAKYCGLGLSGVVLATNISTLLVAVSLSIQYRKIITDKARGIWNK